MRKTLKEDNLTKRSASRAIVALALSASLAAFGCTTNQTRSNGEPVTTPGVGPSTPASSSTPGTSASLDGSHPAPMTSSYRGVEPLPAVSARSRADLAASIMAQHEPLRQARVLGPADPGSSGRGYVSDGATNVFVPPALLTNPQRTVNSSISSPSTPAIVSGAGGGGGGVVGGATLATTVNGATTAAATNVATTTGTTDSAAVFPATAHPVTPTNAALPLSAGVFSGGTSAVAAQTAAGGLGVTNVLATPLNASGLSNAVSVTDTGVTGVLASSTNAATATGTTATTATTTNGITTFSSSLDKTTLAGTGTNASITNANSRVRNATSTNAATGRTSSSSVRVVRNGGRVTISNQ